MKAFSLIELLISLIVISLIATAFSPILTKRLKYQNTLLSQSSVTSDCSKFDDCLMCDSSNCTLCNSATGQCTACSGEYKLSSDNTCENYTDAPCLKIGNICAAKFNAGDTYNGGLEIPEGVSVENPLNYTLRQ